MPTYRLYQRLKNGDLWTSSEDFIGGAYEAAQAVRAGYLQGEARWARSMPDGQLLFGLTATGKETRSEHDLPLTR